MHISAEWERREAMSVSEVIKKPGYDFFAVFAKAILIIMLTYGSIGGFLSAYQITYNKTICIIVISAVALFLTAAYECNKKVITDSLSFVLLGGFFFYAVKRYWYLNSGYYAIVNKIFEEARMYLGIANRTEYAETIENQYSTITYFVIFIGIIGVILLNIHFAHKIRLWEVVVLTFTPQLLPFYFEKIPEGGYLICMMTGYLVTAVLQGKEKGKRGGRRIGYLLPIAFVFALACIQLFTLFVPKGVYHTYVPQNGRKELTKEAVSDLFLYGAAAVFGGKSNVGISGGMLDGVSSLRPDYETDLIVRFTPYNTEPVYLKAFTTMKYEGNRWYSCYKERETEEFLSLLREEWISDTTDVLKENFADSDIFGAKGIMEVQNVGAAEEYKYYPYYTDFQEFVESQDEDTAGYAYYPYFGSISGVSSKVPEGYLEVSKSCYEAVEEICTLAGFSGTEEEIAAQIEDYFDENYRYTLRPGYAFGNSDYITRFLLKNKKGFCAHFASAATMLFRYMGVPARYVEGYVFTYNDVINSGKIVENANYEDYYSGYSALGETGLIELEIPDANAHAWVEIFVKDKGWIVVDPTPMAEPEEEEAFWDVFGNLGGGELLDDGIGTAGAYLEKVISRTGQVLVWIAVAVILFFIGKRIYFWRVDAKLTKKERITKNYKLLVGYVEKKHREFGKLQTIEEQMKWIREYYLIAEIDEDFIMQLYRVFFAPQISEEEEVLIGERLKMIRKKIK